MLPIMLFAKDAHGLAFVQAIVEPDSSVRKIEILALVACASGHHRGENLMNTTTNTPFVIAFVVVTALLLLFGAGAMTAGIMNGGTHGSGWVGAHSWVWTPALITLGLGVVLGQFIVKKKG